jgi:lipoprotein NlpD
MRMKQSFNWKSGSCALLLCLLAGCASTPNNAPVVERSIEKAPSEQVLAVVEAPSKAIVEPRPSYTVKRGDSLIRIALDHGQSYSDLVAWNNLKNPNDIKVDQVLWIAAPDWTPGTKTSAITPNSGVEIRNLTPINPSNNKTTPRGDKRPYSEANLAELQKNELSQTANLASKIEVPPMKGQENKNQEKPAIVSGDKIEWIWPADGKLISSFDDQKNKGIDQKSKGIELAGKPAQDIIAAAAGKVAYAGSTIPGFGNFVIIQHANNYLSLYAHNKVNLVKDGQIITKGQKIAEMGNSDSDIVKLHFEIRLAGKPVDPMKFLPAR